MRPRIEPGLSGLPPLVLLFTITALTVFQSELTSNTAGTGLLRLPQMMWAGVWPNLAGILVIAALTWLLIAPPLGNVY